MWHVLVSRAAGWGIISHSPSSFPSLHIQSSTANDLGIDLEAIEVRMIGPETLLDEGRTEDRGEDPADVVAEGKADGSGASVRHPVSLSSERAAGDGVGEVLETFVGVQSFGWDCLRFVISQGPVSGITLELD